MYPVCKGIAFQPLGIELGTPKIRNQHKSSNIYLMKWQSAKKT